MLIYYSTCFLSALLMWVESRLVEGTIKIGKKRMSLQFFFLIIAAVPLILVSGFRFDVGTDYVNYKYYFDLINKGIHTEHIEKLYQIIILWFGKHGLDYQCFVFFNTLLFIIPSFICIKRDSPYSGLSVILFVCLGYYFASFNITRQMLGVTVLLISIKYVYEEKIVPFLLLVALATCFHTSCIVFFVIYFFPKFKNNNFIQIKRLCKYFKSAVNKKKIFLLLFIGILLTPLLNYAGRYVVSLTRYMSYLESDLDTGHVGYINIIMQFSILLFATLFSDSSKKYSTFYNLQVINTFLGLMYMVPLIRRVQYIFAAPTIILIPLSINNMKSKEGKTLAMIAAIILSVLYCYFILRAGYHGALPYQSILE